MVFQIEESIFSADERQQKLQTSVTCELEGFRKMILFWLSELPIFLIVVVLLQNM